MKDKTTPFPKELKYLEPVLRKMRKIPVDELNEDADATAINEALLGRIKALGRRGASKWMAADRDALRTWLETSEAEDAAAWWIVGYLMRPGSLVRRLLDPSEPAVVATAISFEPPTGWTMSRVEYGIQLRQGRLWGSIQQIDRKVFKHLRDYYGSMEELLAQEPPQSRKSRDKWIEKAVRAGKCHGHKFIYMGTAPKWKEVKYLLTVPGGIVHTVLCAMGRDFSESAFDKELHTLRVIQPEDDK